MPNTTLRNKTDGAPALGRLNNVVETNSSEENKVISCRKKANTVKGAASVRVKSGSRDRVSIKQWRICCRNRTLQNYGES